MKKQLHKWRFAIIWILLISFQWSFAQLSFIDVAPGPPSSFATDFEAVGPAVFFAAVDIGGDDEPHIFDPMLGPTPMKIDVNPAGSSIPAEFTDIGGDVFFSAEDEFGDRELYIFDSMGMLTKIDVDPAGSSMPFRLTDVGGTLFFTATVAGDKEAYYFDGVSAVKIDTDPAGSGDPEEYTFAGGLAFFVATVAGDEELYMFDGVTLTKIDVNPAGSSDPNELTTVGPDLYFNAESTTGDKELHKYDTALSMLTEIDVSATGSSSPFALYTAEGVLADGILYFTASDLGDVEMYKYDTIMSSLTKIDIDPAGSSFPAIFPGNYLKVGTSIFVPAEDAATGDRELYEYDTITTMVTKIDVNPSGPSAPLELVEMFGKLYFTADDPSTGKELYVFDGSLSLIELNPSGSGMPFGLTVTDAPALYLGGTDGVSGAEMFEYLDPTLSIDEPELADGFKMYPNPAKSTGFVQIEMPHNSVLNRVSIYSIGGNLVQETEVEQQGNEIKVSLANLASGMYFLNIQTSRSSVIKKLIVE